MPWPLDCRHGTDIHGKTFRHSRYRSRGAHFGKRPTGASSTKPSGSSNRVEGTALTFRHEMFALCANAVNDFSLSTGRPTTRVSHYAGGISVISRWLSEATPPGSIAAAIFESCRDSRLIGHLMSFQQFPWQGAIQLESIGFQDFGTVAKKTFRPDFSAKQSFKALPLRILVS
jgi:hypothetical protein